MDYPQIVQVETASSCNASCSFCPHSTMSRSPAIKMPSELFRKLVDEIASWPVHPNHFVPFLTNEPFADSRIYDLCRYVNQRLPEVKLAFFTNGTLFTPSNLDKLSTVSNIDFIHISWHHGNKADYEAELGVSFEKAIESVQRLINYNRWTVRIGRVQNGDADKDAEFLAFSRDKFGHIPAMLSYRYNWKGDIDSTYDYRTTLDHICTRHNTMSVLVDGRVALCCMDQEGQYSLGDSNQSTLLDIYNGPTALAYRARIKRFSEPCNKCNVHP